MRITVVIPTIPGRESILARILEAYRHTTPGLELIVEEGHPTCGLAWQAGAARATGDYLHFGADDLEPLSGWWRPLVEAVDDDKCPCPIVFGPDGVSVQSAGATGWTLHTDIPEDWSETGWTTVPFMSREQWRIVDPMIPTHYCTDTWVSIRLRHAGIPTVVRSNSWFVHHEALPGRGAGMEINARNIHDRARFYEAVAALEVAA